MMAEVVAELMEGKRSIEFIVISSASTLSLSRRNTRFLLLFIVVVNAVVGRHKMKVLIAQPRAQGEDGMGPSSVRGHRSFGISPGGGGDGSEVLLLRLRSRLISAAASLSVLVHICVRLSWGKSVLVRSFVRSRFLLVFRLYLFLIARPLFSSLVVPRLLFLLSLMKL